MGGFAAVGGGEGLVSRGGGRVGVPGTKDEDTRDIGKKTVRKA